MMRSFTEMLNSLTLDDALYATSLGLELEINDGHVIGLVPSSQLIGFIVDEEV
jgi:hypothetical protein